MPIDYKRWDHIEISDDEDDTHPNVDTPSLFRWRHQARLERMAEKKQQKEELEIAKTDGERKIAELRSRMEDASLSEEERGKARDELAEVERQEEQWRQKERELLEKEQSEPLNVDTIGHEKWSRSRINKVKPKEPVVLSEEEETKLSKEFFETHREKMREFGKLNGFDPSEAFLVENPVLCCDRGANLLTIDCLNAAILDKKEKVERISFQCIIIQYLLELCKQLGSNPSEPNMIRQFFHKLKQADAAYLKMFMEEVNAFRERIWRRAKEKRDEAMAEAEEEERQQRIAQSPGGLDPADVFEALPKAMQEAFESREVGRLQAVAATMDKKEFSYHLQRCIDSGLWVANANDSGVGGDSGDEASAASKDDSGEQQENAVGDASESAEAKKDR